MPLSDPTEQQVFATEHWLEKKVNPWGNCMDSKIRRKEARSRAAFERCQDRIDHPSDVLLIGNATSDLGTTPQQLYVALAEFGCIAISLPLASSRAIAWMKSIDSAR
eukprot:gene766-4055_t